MTLSIIEKLTHATVRIETDGPNGPGAGTGFYYNFQVDGKSDIHIPAIVTCRHVVEATTRGRFHLTQQNQAGDGPDTGSHFPVEAEVFSRRWIYHPDPSIDLCVMPAEPIFAGARDAGFKPFTVSLDSSLVATPELLGELGPFEDVTLVGYPTGLWDSKHNLPIVRRGVTATAPGIPFDGNPEFLIDAAVFGGSSGLQSFYGMRVPTPPKQGMSSLEIAWHFLGFSTEESRRTSWEPYQLPLAECRRNRQRPCAVRF